MGRLVIAVLLLVEFFAFGSAQRSAGKRSLWQTLDGNPPLVVARGGFSGLFPDSSSYAYNFAMLTSVSDLVLWCEVQLTKDGTGICFPDIKLDNSSNIAGFYRKREHGYFTFDFDIKELTNVSLNQGNYGRSPAFDTSLLQIFTVDEVFKQNKPSGFWLNIQNDALYNQHKLSMRSFVLGASKRVIITHISSPEVGFLRGISKAFRLTPTKLIFRFLDQDETEPSTNQTYGSLGKNLTFIKTFAAGILVPKIYIWPVDGNLYLQPHTSLVADAHKIGLEVFAADFSNDVSFAYNYSYDPVAEYMSFIDNGEFSVDGVLSDFPVTPSAARDCFAHHGKNASGQAKPLVISHNGASGDYPDCTDKAYAKAISDGADIIDCPVQMSKDGTPFCSSSVNLMNTTLASSSEFRNLLSTVTELQGTAGIYSFSLNWSSIQGLTPAISNPFPVYSILRNPKAKNDGKLISLSEFLSLSQNATSLSGVLIKIDHAAYLAEKQGLDVIGAVLDALDKAGHNNQTLKRVMIQSTNSSVLEKLKGKKYELVYEVGEQIHDVQKDTIAEIKSFANSVVIYKSSVFPRRGGFIEGMTDVVSKIQSSKLSVYVQIFQNEFVSQAYDVFSDPTAELNTYSMGASVDGFITDFPKTAAAYKKNRCLKMKVPPPYMGVVQPGQLLQLISPPAAQPPAEAPYPDLKETDVGEPPLPAVIKNATATTPAPAGSTPKPSSNGQHQITISVLFFWISMFLVFSLLFQSP